MTVFPYHFSACSPQVKRHGPSGYIQYSSFKPWLRDEYDYRCVYCLGREIWDQQGLASFAVEHLVAKSKDSSKEVDYLNLVYACNTCNSNKNIKKVPEDLLDSPVGQHIVVDINGDVESRTASGEWLIDELKLRDESRVEFRKKIIEIWKLYTNGKNNLQSFFGYPLELDDLSKLVPPGGNIRPEGMTCSAYRLKKLGIIPLVY